MKNLKKAIFKKSPALQLGSLIEQADHLIEAKEVSHLVIVDEQNHFLGNIKAKKIKNIAADKKVDELTPYFEPFFLLLDHRINLLDTYHLFKRYRTNILPVLNEKHQLLGVLKKKKVRKLWDKTTFINTNAAVIEVQTSIHNYSLSVLAQIVESNNAKLYGMIVSAINQESVVILIKTNAHNTATILSDFRRFDYQVLSFDPSDAHATQIEDRTQYLNKYLDI